MCRRVRGVYSCPDVSSSIDTSEHIHLAQTRPEVARGACRYLMASSGV